MVCARPPAAAVVPTKTYSQLQSNWNAQFEGERHERGTTLGCGLHFASAAHARVSTSATLALPRIARSAPFFAQARPTVGGLALQSSISRRALWGSTATTLVFLVSRNYAQLLLGIDDHRCVAREQKTQEFVDFTRTGVCVTQGHCGAPRSAIRWHNYEGYCHPSRGPCMRALPRCVRVTSSSPSSATARAVGRKGLSRRTFRTSGAVCLA